jgi:Tol biopolymer transport system component
MSGSPTPSRRAGAGGILLAAAILAPVAGAGLLAAGPALAGPTGSAGSAGPTGSTSRISVTAAGVEGDAGGGPAAISADGRFVAFQSESSNLVPGDTNDFPDVFLLDRRTGTVSRISVASTGRQGDGVASAPAISRDGRYVSYHASSTNLVPGDTNGVSDVFVYDRRTAATERVSLPDTRRQGDGWSATSAISADGRFVAFHSAASNLVTGDTNGTWDVFLRDRLAGTTERVNVSTTGGQVTGSAYGVAISGDGRFVGFGSSAAGLVPEDTDELGDVFVRDVRAGTTERVSRTATGVAPNSHSLDVAMSDDGRLVVFLSYASNLVPGDTNFAGDIFVRDRRTGRLELASLTSAGAQANGPSSGVTISPDGRYVGFTSDASNLVPGDTNAAGDVFIRDRRTGDTERISVATSGEQGNGYSFQLGLSHRARYAVFGSNASNLVPGDTNGVGDAFLRTR